MNELLIMNYFIIYVKIIRIEILLFPRQLRSSICNTGVIKSIINFSKNFKRNKINSTFFTCFYM